MSIYSIRVTADQKQLLILLVAAFRSAARKEPFFLSETNDGDTLIHSGLAADFSDFYPGDLEALLNAGLLSKKYISRGSASYDISPLGFEYTDHARGELGTDFVAIE